MGKNFLTNGSNNGTKRFVFVGWGMGVAGFGVSLWKLGMGQDPRSEDRHPRGRQINSPRKRLLE